jgi:hypothetical protein
MKFFCFGRIFIWIIEKMTDIKGKTWTTMAKNIDRRTFMKTTLAAGAGVALMGSLGHLAWGEHDKHGKAVGVYTTGHWLCC